jgi:hypothetical protein
MHADIRFPIGLLFSIIGILLAVYGFMTTGAAMYSHPLNININIYSGVCLTIFGVLMLVMALAAQKRQKS